MSRWAGNPSANRRLTPSVMRQRLLMVRLRLQELSENAAQSPKAMLACKDEVDELVNAALRVQAQVPRVDGTTTKHAAIYHGDIDGDSSL